MATSWQHIATYRSNGSAAGPSTVLGEDQLVGVGALSGVGHAFLGLPVLGQHLSSIVYSKVRILGSQKRDLFAVFVFVFWTSE